MATRGFIGFYYRGKYYLSYNHWDSSPSGKGRGLLNQLLKEFQKYQNFSRWLAWFLALKFLHPDEVTEPQSTILQTKQGRGSSIKIIIREPKKVA